jgi:hypothetical protein
VCVLCVVLCVVVQDRVTTITTVVAKRACACGLSQASTMLCNCQRSSGVVSNVPELVRDKLEAVARIYPHTKYVCVLDNSGELM